MSWFNFNLQDFSISFLGILFEGVPFMFIGTLLSGLIDAFVPAERIGRMPPRNRTAAIGLSGVLGVVFPMCECGMVPLVRRLVRKGLPVSCGLTYLLAAPIVNPIVALSTFAAFRGQHPGMGTSMRMSLGFVVAVLCGFIVQRIPVTAVLNRRMLASLPRPRQSAPKAVPVLQPALVGADGNNFTSETEAAVTPPFHLHHEHAANEIEDKSFFAKIIGASAARRRIFSMSVSISSSARPSRASLTPRSRGLQSSRSRLITFSQRPA